MGRIRTRWVKTVAGDLLDKFPEKFGNDFDKNKEALRAMDLIEDKSVRNKVAGYMVTIANKTKF
ncbi:MAG: 30S ribosomal protein S17e [Candidatus Aenigmarchaeota archaeon]|nr:30S ribosomal protein S17e [Candidatus Aenigmarchaeota archaeon]